MHLLQQIKQPILGFSFTIGSFVFSLQNITEIAQCVAALLAVVIGMGTIRLTILKIHNEQKKQAKNEKN